MNHEAMRTLIKLREDWELTHVSKYCRSKMADQNSTSTASSLLKCVENLISAAKTLKNVTEDLPKPVDKGKSPIELPTPVNKGKNPIEEHRKLFSTTWKRKANIPSARSIKRPFTIQGHGHK